jgi:hypothetical protein
MAIEFLDEPQQIRGDDLFGGTSFRGGGSGFSRGPDETGGGFNRARVPQASAG